ncbi:transmembrane protein 151B [Caerostris extrusa]|uniref:Transmembrane protein 151B n=1 Tax=Caerostris extrusa TaxID=172846 RepID=A0AAV4P664_CAEEX|nr:transmembrane protein 151B [Caerostris extrusa]
MFWIFSLLLLSWPLRVAIDIQTAVVHFQVKKMFGGNPLAAYGYPDIQLSRINTPDSCELERMISNQFNPAPSYSEAMLIDSNCPFPSMESGIQMETFRVDLPSCYSITVRPTFIF